LVRDGFCIVPLAIEPAQIRALVDSISPLISERHGMRNLLRIPAVRRLADGEAIRGLVEPVLGGCAQVVRGLFFDKTPDANWNVAWHQDLSIAVRERIDVPGFGPWSIKDGVQHVQPPREVLERMVTIRLHLDDCDEENGPLRVISGSHARGVLPPAELAQMTEQGAAVACIVGRGGAVVMRPLILHASSKAPRPSHRRVIHLEFCSAELPAGLQWAAA
jgi:ectoine hydroxylase-related dioxygenase (phytanoyl-CoA dioxygenase family)